MTILGASVALFPAGLHHSQSFVPPRAATCIPPSLLPIIRTTKGSHLHTPVPPPNHSYHQGQPPAYPRPSSQSSNLCNASNQNLHGINTRKPVQGSTLDFPFHSRIPMGPIWTWDQMLSTSPQMSVKHQERGG